MTTYQSLKAQLETLSAEAEVAKQRETVQAVAEIRRLIEQYDITPDHIFGRRASRDRRDKRRGPTAIKYRNPETGETWCGRGRPPRWLAGQNRDDYLVRAAS
jgi:DNA-binding protein H-NS